MNDTRDRVTVLISPRWGIWEQQDETHVDEVRQKGGRSGKNRAGRNGIVLWSGRLSPVGEGFL